MYLSGRLYLLTRPIQLNSQNQLTENYKMKGIVTHMNSKALCVNYYCI